MTAKEYRAEIAQSFLNVLSEKGLEWKKGWNGFGMNTPMNGATGYKYKGINRFSLSMISMMRGYEDPRFCTYKQIEKNGWKLVNAKKQGVKVEYWFPYDPKEKRGLTWKEYGNAEEEVQKRCQIRAVFKTVFNASLIEGIEPFPEPEINDIQPDELVETLSTNMNVPIIHDGGDRAFYRPLDDTIHLPLPGYFENEYEYGSTALHELAHSTGATHRLNRSFGERGSAAYAFEELVAEISSCFMSVNLKTEQSKNHLDNHKAYVQSWVSAIKKSPDVLVKAVQEAEKTASYMEYKAGIIKQEEFKTISEASAEVPVAPVPTLEQNIEYSNKETKATYSDAFFVNEETKTVTWIYYNPDSNAGGQYVTNIISYENIMEAAADSKGVEDFFVSLSMETRQTLVDRGTPEFADMEKWFLQSPDISDLSEKTMQRLISLTDVDLTEKQLSVHYEKMEKKDISVRRPSLCK